MKQAEVLNSKTCLWDLMSQELRGVLKEIKGWHWRTLIESHTRPKGPFLKHWKLEIGVCRACEVDEGGDKKVIGHIYLIASCHTCWHICLIFGTRIINPSVSYHSFDVRSCVSIDYSHYKRYPQYLKPLKMDCPFSVGWKFLLFVSLYSPWDVRLSLSFLKYQLKIPMSLWISGHIF